MFPPIIRHPNQQQKFSAETIAKKRRMRMRRDTERFACEKL
jgi:hypothetical protein